jgi:predicted nuclease with TOPRIM domain
MQAEYDAEVACGRKRQQEFEAEMNANRERVKRMEAEQAAKEGSMVPVHHPNPTQGEVFPVNKATFK